MDQLNKLFGAENGSALQLVLITLVLVICLIIIVWIVRRVAGSPARKAARGRVPRLSIADSTAVDDKRHLVLVRRDNVEHLIMIGGPSDVVVESGIVRVQPAAQPNNAQQVTSPREPEASKPVTPPAETQPQPTTGTVAAAGGVMAAEALANDSSPEASHSSPQIDKNTADAVDSALEAMDLGEVEANLGAVDEASVSQSSEPEIEPVIETSVEPEVPTVVEEAAPQEPEVTASLEDSITQSLDEALSSEDFEISLDSSASDGSEIEAPAVETGGTSDGKQDDDMQRLLDELAGESRGNG